MKMEKNILPFIELEDIASFNYPVYAHMKEKDGITIYETLEEHTNRCKYYFKRIFYQKELDCVVRRFSEALEFKNKKAVYRWMIKLLWQMIIFHDIGKCNPNFQRKKMKNNDDSIPESLKGLSGTEHSFLSSILYLDYFFDLLEKEEAFEKKEKKKMWLWPISALGRFARNRYQRISYHTPCHQLLRHTGTINSSREDVYKRQGSMVNKKDLNAI